MSRRCRRYLVRHGFLIAFSGLLIVACGGGSTVETGPPSGTQPAADPALTVAAGGAASPLVIGDGGGGVDALNSCTAAARDVEELLVCVRELSGMTTLALTGVPSQAREAAGDSATWIAITLPETANDRDADASAWRAYLAAGVVRDSASDRDWSVPAGISVDFGRGGLGNSVSMLLEPGTATRPALASRSLPASAADAESMIRQAVSSVDGLTLESMDFVSSLSPVPIVRLVSDEPAEVLPRLRRLDLGAGRVEYEGWWLELRSTDGELAFVSAVARRLGRGSTWIEPSLQHGE